MGVRAAPRSIHLQCQLDWKPEFSASWAPPPNKRRGTLPLPLPHLSGIKNLRARPLFSRLPWPGRQLSLPCGSKTQARPRMSPRITACWLPKLRVFPSIQREARWSVGLLGPVPWRSGSDLPASRNLCPLTPGKAMKDSFRVPWWPSY